MATDTETAAAISSHNTAANGHTSRGDTAGRPASPTTGDVYVNTQTGFVEVYTGATYGWEQVGGIASTPTSVVATNQPSGRAFNNGQASVAFTAGTVLGRTYTVTSSPGSYTATGSTSPLTVTGLQSNTSYTYTVTATNNYGTSSASSASSAVTATTVPQAPTISASAGNSSATLTLSGSNGGLEITQYTITSNPATTTQTTSNTTYNFTGLTNNTAYTFTATATNANGTSATGPASNSVTPENIVFSVDYLVLAGGGGARVATYYSGGAGAGGLRCTNGSANSGRGASLESAISINTLQPYSITVGSGGSGTTDGTLPNNGSNSVFHTVTSIGGGAGAVNDFHGNNGGCGGGAGGNDSVRNGGSGTSGQGYDGGNVSNNSGGPGAGGGGVASAGTSSSGNLTVAGSGGSALSNTLSGTSISYGAGSGGARGYWPDVGQPGGNGSNGSGWSFTSNRGHAGNTFDSNQKNGSSGVVILYYPDARTINFGVGVVGTESSPSGGYKRAIITAATAGTVSWS